MSDKDIEKLINACNVLRSNYECDNFDENQKEYTIQSDIEYIIELLNSLENK